MQNKWPNSCLCRQQWDGASTRNLAGNNVTTEKRVKSLYGVGSDAFWKVVWMQLL